MAKRSDLSTILAERRKERGEGVKALSTAIMGKETNLSTDELSALVTATTGHSWTPPSLSSTNDTTLVEVVVELAHQLEDLTKRLEKLEADKRKRHNRNRNRNQGNNNAQANQANQGNNNTTP